MARKRRTDRFFYFLFAGLIWALASGCKSARDVADQAASEVTGYRAFKQSEGVQEKVRKAEQMEMERAQKMKDMINNPENDGSK